MGAKYWKLIFKDIFSSFSKFIAIVSIVALGISFIVGLITTYPNMKHSMDLEYNKHEVADISIRSTIGFDKDTLDKLSELSQVTDVMGAYIEDKTVVFENQNIVARIAYLPFSNNLNLNKLELREGGFPKNDLELVVEMATDTMRRFEIGDLLNIDGKMIKVVGIVRNPVYFSNMPEMSTLPNQTLDTMLYFDEIHFNHDFFTDVFIRVAEATKFNTFSNEYNQLITSAESEIQVLEEELLESRYQRLYRETLGIVTASYVEQLKETLLAEGRDPAEIPGLVLEIVESNLIKSFLERTTIKILEDQFADVEPQWFILNRNFNTSFVKYQSDGEIINSVSLIFAVFFLVIVVLVATSSLTRMIEEHRKQIGTLKSLGYSRKVVTFKYMFYGFVTAFLGSVIGVLIGVFLLPEIIYNAYAVIYYLPELSITYHLGRIELPVLAMLVSVVCVAYFTVQKTLQEKPAHLLATKAPKTGGTILLEKAGWFWNRLKFRYKSTFRNIFRNKKNIFMTVIGISGSTALLITGIGFKSSLDYSSKYQAETVYNHDLIIGVHDELALPELSEYDTLLVYTASGIAIENEKRINFNFVVPKDVEKLNDFFGLYEPKSTTRLNFDDKSVIISRQISEMLNLNIGNQITIVDSLSNKTYFKITGVTDNYLDNYIYISPYVLMESNPNIDFNNYLVKSNLEGEARNALKTELSKNSNVHTVQFIDDHMKLLEKSSESLTLIVVVIVIFAAALAVIVNYSLTLIDISTKEREIATLKVLGYNKSEVSGYVFRERVLVSTFAILVGQLVGFLLHQFVISIVVSEGFILGSNASWLSYVISIVVSFFLVGAIYFMSLPTMAKISMTESLQSY